MRAMLLHPRRFRCQGVRLRHRGFALLELLVVVGVMGLLAGATMPAMRSLVVLQGRKGAIAELLGAFASARAQALLRGLPAYVIFPAHAAEGPAWDALRLRAWALAQDTEEGGITVLTPWHTLPQGVCFKDVPDSVLGMSEDGEIPNVKFFPDLRHDATTGTTSTEGRPQVLLHFVQFDESGMIEVPAQAGRMAVYIVEGRRDASGAERPISRGQHLGDDQDAGRNSDVIRLSQFTGQARWIAPDPPDP